MGNQSKIHIELWTVALGMIGIGFLIGFFVPQTRSLSPSIAYQEGMLSVCAGSIRLLGSILLLVSLFVTWRKSLKITRKCPKCGAVPPSKIDKFCRKCGEALSV